MRHKKIIFLSHCGNSNDLLLLFLSGFFLRWKLFQQNDGMRDSRVVGTDTFRSFGFNPDAIWRNAQNFATLARMAFACGPILGAFMISVESILEMV